MPDDDFNAIIISETHWDRAWYLSFEQFRIRLVRLVDKLLDILETDPTFSHYTFDGQTVILEDYLEVKPDRRDRLMQLIKSGRIDIGPWYILPDEFLVSGESLIRNLLRGKRIAREFGAWMDVGYVPDPFGHVSQMPQILTQFGIDSFIFARGTGEESEDLGAEFIWEATDGSEVMAHWLPLSYGNAANLPEDVDDAAYFLRDVLKELKARTRIGTCLLMNGSDHLEPQAHLPEVIRRFNEQNEDKIIIGTLPMFAERMREHKPELKRFRGELRRSKYQNLLSGVYSSRVYIKQANDFSQRLLERHVEPLCIMAWLQGGRYPSDEIRLAWRYLLLNHPHDDICGCSIDEVHDDNMIRHRWIGEIAESLVQEATGVIIQRVQKESAGIGVINLSPRPRSGIATFEIPASDFRYSRLSTIELADPELVPATPLEAAKNEMHIAYVRRTGFDIPPINEREISIGNEQIHEFEFDFSALAMLDATLKGALRHLSTNYLVRVNSRNEIVEVWAKKHDAEGAPSATFALQSPDGERVLLQLLDLEYKRDPLNYLTSDAEEFLQVALEANDIPPLGVKRYDLIVEDKRQDFEVEEAVRVTPEGMENEFLRVSVQDKGTITLLDKRTSQEYKGLLTFEDSGDVGDTYDYSPASQPSLVFVDNEVEIEIGHRGPLVASMMVSGELQIPEGIGPDGRTRAEDHVDCPFVIELVLKKGSPTLECTIVLDNQAEDHRLRVLFPTNAAGETCIADSTFDLIERPLRPKEYPDWKQPVAPTCPLRNAIGLGDDHRGLWITTKGLHEFEVLDDGNGTVAITLLRAVGWLSKIGFATRGDSAGPLVEVPGAQCIGQHTFELAITPLSKTWMEDNALARSEEYLIPFVTAFIPKGDTGQASEGDTILGIELRPDTMQLSALKLSEDGKYGVLRFWNSSDAQAECELEFGFNVDTIVAGKMDESIDQEQAIERVNARTFKMLVPGRRVMTVLFTPKSR